MSIISFIKSLLPRLQKADIEEDIRVTLKELSQLAIPEYYTASTSTDVVKFTSDEVKLFEKAFYNNVKLKSSGKSFIADIHAALQRMHTNLVYLQKLATEVLEADLINEGLTAKKAHIVQAVSKIAFTSNFSISFLDYIYTLETAALDTENQTQIPPAQKKYFDSKYLSFYQCLDSYGMDPDKFQKVFTEIPEVALTSKNAESVLQVFKPTQIEPFGGFSKGFTGSPIYNVRLVVAEWQGRRYNANKDKKKLLELKLLNLKSLQDKTPNPRLQQEIDYIQKRVDKLDHYLRDFEESVSMGA